MRVTYYGTVADSSGNAPDPEPEIRLTVAESGNVIVDNVELHRDGFSIISFNCPILASITLTLDGTLYEFIASAEEGLFHLADAIDIPLIRRNVDPLEEVADQPLQVSDATLWVATHRILLVEIAHADVPLFRR